MGCRCGSTCKSSCGHSPTESRGSRAINVQGRGDANPANVRGPFPFLRKGVLLEPADFFVQFPIHAISGSPRALSRSSVRQWHSLDNPLTSRVALDTRAASMPRAALQMTLMAILSAVATAAELADEMPPAAIPMLDLSGMQKKIMAHDKFVLLSHTTDCARAEEFAPTLARIAARVPGLAYGRVAMDTHAHLKTSTAVQAGTPTLKAFFRNAPPTRRVLEYSGVPTFDAVLSWAKAIDEWDGSDSLPAGWEVGKPTYDKKLPKQQKDEV